MDEWIEIVPPTSPHEADLRFNKWKLDHSEQAKNLRDEDVCRDLIRSIEKQVLVRYRIRIC